MYVILVNNDNSLITTVRERVMQRSKLVNDLWILVDEFYNGHSMADCTVLMEYIMPVSKQYRSEILVLSDDRYENRLKYILPFGTKLTAEPGKIEIQLSFIYSDLDSYGESVQRVRKTLAETIDIIPIAAWSDIIPDDALSALDQRIIKTDAQIKALSDLSDTLYHTKADDISYNEEENELQLLSCGVEIGKKITIKSSGESLKDGIPVVDFSNKDVAPDGSEEDDNIIEF